jgi:hypothetical protein
MAAQARWHGVEENETAEALNELKAQVCPPPAALSLEAFTHLRPALVVRSTLPSTATRRRLRVSRTFMFRSPRSGSGRAKRSSRLDPPSRRANGRNCWRRAARTLRAPLPGVRRSAMTLGRTTSKCCLMVPAAACAPRIEPPVLCRLAGCWRLQVLLCAIRSQEGPSAA